MRHLILLLLPFVLLSCQPSTSNPITKAETKTEYQELVQLFKDWRSFEKPPMLEGAPDYTKAHFSERRPVFDQLQAQLLAFDTTGWAIPEKVDWMIVWAEMNGYDFNDRILKPWERDPAYYKSLWMARSDVPAHEGPTHHATTEIWAYNFPLSDSERARLIGDLKVIPPLNEQAKQNLTGNARDLWVAGIRDIKRQSRDLAFIKAREGLRSDQEITGLIDAAITSTNNL
ncbi:MAG: hypothetical protein AAF242_19875, partial [Bacteroidota bacterium]